MSKAKDWPLEITWRSTEDLPGWQYYSLGHHPKLKFLRALRAELEDLSDYRGCGHKVEHIYVRIQASIFGDDDYSFYIIEVPGPRPFARKATVLR